MILFFRLIFAALFVGTIFAGVYLMRNYERLFGVDPAIPSENSSARSYTKIQVFGVWAHVLVLTGALAVLLH